MEQHDGQAPADARRAEAALRAAFADLELAPGTRARQLHAVRHRAASRGPAPGRLQPGSPWQRLRLRAAAATAAATFVLGGGAGTALAAGEAAPGERLYPVKLALEQAALRIPAGAETRVQQSLTLAQRRLDEVTQLGSSHGALLAVGLAGHRSHLNEAEQLAAGDADLEAAVEAAAAQAARRLAELLDGDLSEQAADRALEALNAVRERLEERSQTGPEVQRRQEERTRGERPSDVPPDQDTPPAGDQRPQQPGRSGEAQQDRRPSTAPGPGSRPHSDARPGGGSPPPSPGSRAPREPRS